MSSDPRVIIIREDAILLAVASAQGHKFDSGGFDDGTFLFDYTVVDAAAVLQIKLFFAKVNTLDPDTTEGWFMQTHSLNEAVSVLVQKVFQFVPGATGDFFFELPIPLMDKAVKVEVAETSASKGNLTITAVGTSLGKF